MPNNQNDLTRLIREHIAYQRLKQLNLQKEDSTPILEVNCFIKISN